MNNELRTTETATLADVHRGLDNIQAFLDGAIDGVIRDKETGEELSYRDKLSYVYDLVMCTQLDLEAVTNRLIAITGEAIQGGNDE